MCQMGGSELVSGKDANPEQNDGRFGLSESGRLGRVQGKPCHRGALGGGGARRGQDLPGGARGAFLAHVMQKQWQRGRK